MNFINRISILLNDKFPQNWINESFDYTKNEEIIIQEFSNLLSESTNRICTYLNYSILSGEYVTEENLKKKFDDLITQFKNIGNVAEVEPKNDMLYNLHQRFFLELTEYFIKPFLFIVKNYKALSHSIDRKLEKHNSHTLLFDAHKKDPLKSDVEKSLNPDIYTKIRIIQHNLELVDFDFNLTLDEDILSNCFIISHEISQLNSDEVCHTIIQQKANYLIYKILYRYEQDEKNYLYALEFQDTEIDKNKLDVGIFEIFKTITDHHYDDQKIKSKFNQKSAQQFFNKIAEQEQHSFRDYHAIIKYLKDEKHSLEQLKNIAANYPEFKKSYLLGSSTKKYDQKSVLTNENYIYNNELSLKINKGEVNLYNWENEFEKFKSLSAQNNVHNYFPYFKLAKLLDSEIENIFKNENIDLIHVQNLIVKFEDVVKELYKAFEWCVNNDFIAFILPFEESIVKTTINDDEEMDVFLHTSFVLPLNYPKIKNEIEDIKSKILRFNTVIGIQSSLIIQKKEIKKVQDYIDKNEKRSIEILSIFSAIVLFVLGDIQIFSKTENPVRAFQFMILFAFSLCLFVLLIWIITRSEGFKFGSLSKFHYFAMLLYSVGTIVVFMILTNNPPFNKSFQFEEIENLKMVIDSIRSTPLK